MGISRPIAAVIGRSATKYQETLSHLPSELKLPAETQALRNCYSRLPIEAITNSVDRPLAIFVGR